MHWFEALLLGIIQGISEFLPISSSAHLVIAEKLLGIRMSTGSLTFEVLLHAASLLAVICFFWRDLLVILRDFFHYLFTKDKEAKANYRFAWLIVGATIITMGVGKGIEGVIGNNLTNSSTIGASLIVTGIFLILMEHGINIGKRTVKDMTWKDCVIIGFGQALAVIPGISRAGSTLIVSLWCGLDKKTAVRYSFLLSIPVITGITILKIPEITTNTFSGVGFELFIACITSFIFAIIGIQWLIQMLNQAKLTYFAIYCIGLGTITWIFLNDLQM
ncbi:undecaprenyl-diphosphate phosphatase [Alkalihalobacillus sp. BA299]|uniref:undecaprenyl-diphosphate phosphatase n=1 Tax=Alkalihalobacillus sp. BA299 TaxID=2815938 RepID=UPI001ADBB7FA|nr:undecaprenyl-diphosphate phosphatase [Alkalihalobacillus sp. BA299]